MPATRLVLITTSLILMIGCDRPPTGEADHSMHDHSQRSHGVVSHAMESSPGAVDAPHALQFLDTMIALQKGAIDTALLANTRTQRSEMKALTRAIIDELRREIAEMQAWREKWFGDARPAVNMDFPGMKTGMAGIDTVKIAGLKANEFDVEFMKQMIPHHQGGIEMAKALRSDDRYPELQKLADSIIASQSVEIEQMKGWLGVWSGTQK